MKHNYDWEKETVAQLYREYRLVCAQHQVALRPVLIQLIESQTYWGQWNPVTRTISIARRLVVEYSWFYVQAILKHEMAHQMVHDVYGCAADDREDQRQSHHGEWFQLACRRLGVMHEFTRASVRLQESVLDWRQEKQDDVSHKLLDKVQKLLALATSSNEHEALLAMEKVRELYAKYNFEQVESSQSQNFAHIAISTGKKRIETHQDRILSILVGHFFVEVLTSSLFDAKTGDHFKMIEIIGARENALMAEYVYYFLLQQSEFWVGETMRTSGQKLSRVDRKSLKLGLLEGFAEKLTAAETSASESMSARQESAFSSPSDRSDPSLSRSLSLVGAALAHFRRNAALKDYLKTVYPRVKRTTGNRQAVDLSLYEVGRSIGQTITLHKAVAAQGQNSGRLLKG